MNKNPIKREDILEIYVDGASRGNKGPSAYAFIFVKKDDGEIHQGCGFIGEQTNNIAEYTAIINALRAAEKFTRWQVRVYSDSKLVIKQINKDYRIKASHLSELCEKVYRVKSKFEKVEFFHVRRDNFYIKKCDALCNSCLDDKGF
ncbi:MAG: ribonuclease HI family protein [Promethearchaeota archaeon]